MIEDLKDTEIVNRMGGRFRLSALIQKRMLEVMQGARPLIEDTEGKSMMEIVVQEIKEGKVVIDDGSDAPKPKKPLL
ncbi:MAG: DNA-directed RNA polymerase subunit omega [Planctomycetes bacterium]|nr:DNA-directed RNA polymerase subunit omega [Planctomycetota bacterium]